MRSGYLLPIVPRAVPRLLLGIVCFGGGIGAMAQAGLGLGPWSALHQGLGRQLGVPLGTVDILLSVPIVLAFIPLRQRPGLGTVLSATLLGSTTNAVALLVPHVEQLWPQVAVMSAGVTAIGLGSALYLTAAMGPGPRDGIMTGLHHRFGWRIRTVRTVLEVAVLAVGFSLGGTVGVGTFAYALVIGHVVEFSLKLLGYESHRRKAREIAAE